jgi:enoyl-CoA hydratase
MSQLIQTEITSGVMCIRLNRPQAKNAVNRAMALEIEGALRQLDESGDIRVGVVSGGGEIFCAGMDLKAFARGETPILEESGFAGLARAKRRKPLIAAVEGYALAGGFEMVLACDLVVASQSAKFGLPEVKRGLVAGGGGLIRLPHRMPRFIATELALTGSMLSAERAYALGLVSRLVGEGSAESAAIALAAEIAENGPLAVQGSKEIMDMSIAAIEDDLFVRQEQTAQKVMSSADAREGAVAFAERRKPQWTGV